MFTFPHRDDPREGFSRTLPGGHLLELPFDVVAESKLESLESMLSPSYTAQGSSK